MTEPILDNPTASPKPPTDLARAVDQRARGLARYLAVRRSRHPSRRPALLPDRRVHQPVFPHAEQPHRHPAEHDLSRVPRRRRRARADRRRDRYLGRLGLRAGRHRHRAPPPQWLSGAGRHPRRTGDRRRSAVWSTASSRRSSMSRRSSSPWRRSASIAPSLWSSPAARRSPACPTRRSSSTAFGQGGDRRSLVHHHPVPDRRDRRRDRARATPRSAFASSRSAATPSRPGWSAFTSSASA